MKVNGMDINCKAEEQRIGTFLRTRPDQENRATFLSDFFNSLGGRFIGKTIIHRGLFGLEVGLSDEEISQWERIVLDNPVVIDTIE